MRERQLFLMLYPSKLGGQGSIMILRASISPPARLVTHDLLSETFLVLSRSVREVRYASKQDQAKLPSIYFPEHRIYQPPHEIARTGRRSFGLTTIHQ